MMGTPAALEFPVVAGDVEDGSGARSGLHGGVEAYCCVLRARLTAADSAGIDLLQHAAAAAALDRPERY